MTRKLTSLNDMFAVSADKNAKQDIDINLLDSYSKHEFKTYEGERLDEMVESVKEFGIIQPVIVRKKENGHYEILAGHNRTKAAGIARMSTVPCIPIECDDDLAALIVTETNMVQRSFTDMKASEKAKVLATHYKELKKSGKRKKLVAKIEEDRCEIQDKFVPQSREELGAEYGLTGRDVSRYIALTNLIEPFQKLVDEKKMAFNVGVDISFIQKEEQEMIAECMEEMKCRIDLKKAEALKRLAKEGELKSENAKTQIMEILKGVSCKKKVEEKLPEQSRLCLRNDKEREEWLRNYSQWPVWFETPQINAKYYRYDLPDGSYLVAECYYNPACHGTLGATFHLVTDKEPFSRTSIAPTYIIEHLRKVAANKKSV